MLSHTTAAVIGMAGGSTRKNGGKKMTAHSIVVLLGMVVAAMPAGADQQGVKVTPAADLRETDDEEQEDIGDDAGLITNEFQLHISVRPALRGSWLVLAKAHPASSCIWKV